MTKNPIINEEDYCVIRNVLAMVIDTDRDIEIDERELLRELHDKIEDRIEYIRENYPIERLDSFELDLFIEFVSDWDNAEDNREFIEKLKRMREQL
jgi:hypothetical protein